MTKRERKIELGAEEERKARLRALENGPWEGKAEKAWSEIAIAQLLKGIDPATVNLPEAFEDFEVARQETLRVILRPHWEKLVKSKDVPLRDSLDEALSLFQLYELAIETGYIALDDVKHEAREKLARLLWSEGARKYVRAYDYLAVGFLAKRLGLDIGYGTLEPPEVSKNNEGRFAQFVSQHRAWYEDEVDGWLGVLDDYWVLSDDQSDKDIFYKFLRSSKKDFNDEEVLWSYVSGADRFLTLLSDLYFTLTESERPRYGLFYAYWMVRFFGWDLKKSGFFRDKGQTDWSRELLKSSRLEEHFNELQKSSGAKPEMNGKGKQADLWAQYRTTLEQRIEAVGEFWQTTRAFLEEHTDRSTILPRPAPSLKRAPQILQLRSSHKTRLEGGSGVPASRGTSRSASSGRWPSIAPSMRRAQAKITAKYEKQVKSALRKAAKASVSAKKTPPSVGDCTISFGGGFTVCQDNVT